MRSLYLSLLVLLCGASQAQLTIDNVQLTPVEYNVLKYDLSFDTNEDSYAYVDYYRMVEDSLGMVVDSIHEHTALQGPAMSHSFRIFGITPDTEYHYQISAHNASHCTANDLLMFETDTLPTAVSTMDSLYVAEGADLDGYYLTNNVISPEETTLQIYNRDGEVVWYTYHSGAPGDENPENCKQFNITEEENILLLECHELTELDLAGNVVSHVDFNGEEADSLFFHHDAIINEAGNYVVVAAGLRTYPSGDTTITVIDESLLEFDSDGNIVWTWRMLDHFDAYDAVPSNGFFIPILGANAINWGHLNTVYQDSDGNYMLSFKEWHQIVKVNSETGEVMWKLGGDDGDIEFQLGDEFGDQHQINRTPVGTYIMYDNTGLDTLSRILEFSIEFYDIPVAVNQWTWNLPQDNFSHILGSAVRLENGNRNATSGITGSIFEVNSAGEVQWHLRQSDWAYRGFFISSLMDNEIDDIAMGTNPELMCIEEDPYQLDAMPAGGCWSGPGVSDGMFDPDQAGLGTHVLTFKWGWNEESIEIEVSDQTPPCIVSTNDITTYSSELEIYPNPSSGAINLSIESMTNERVLVQTHNLVGELVIDQMINLTEGSNNLVIEEFNNVEQGIYLISLTINGEKLTRRVVKQ